PAEGNNIPQGPQPPGSAQACAILAAVGPSAPMRAVAGGLVVVALAGCDVIFGIKTVARDAAVDTSVDAVVMPRSCKEIHAATATEPSGMYTIDPDGDGDNPPLTVVCDMTTSGGGWTLVFVAPSTDLLMAAPYTATIPALLASAS